MVATVSSLVFIGLSGWIAGSVVDRPQLGPVIIPIAMLSILGQAAFYTTDLGMTGLGRFDRAGLLQAILGVTKLVVSVGLVLFGFGVTGAVDNRKWLRNRRTPSSFFGSRPPLVPFGLPLSSGGGA